VSQLAERFGEVLDVLVLTDERLHFKSKIIPYVGCNCLG
jgi:hypothetical protein